MLKRCSICRVLLRLSAFVVRTSSPDGRSSACRDCSNKRNRELYYAQHDHNLRRLRSVRAGRRAERRELRDQAKARPCADCGEKFPAYVMDFDHRPGTKKLYNVAYLVGDLSKSIGVLRREIAKCDVVCSNCHRIRTHQRKNNEK